MARFTWTSIGVLDSQGVKQAIKEKWKIKWMCQSVKYSKDKNVLNRSLENAEEFK